jgi:hypothetical protein
MLRGEVGARALRVRSTPVTGFVSLGKINKIQKYDKGNMGNI